MTIYFMIFLIELLLLYLFSKNISKKFFTLILNIFKNKRLAVYVYSILFLPGTFAHEFAHFFMALILLVPVGEVELIPQIEEGRVKLGSVAIGKVDLIRRFLVGVAPILMGILFIVSAINIISSRGLLGNAWYILFLAYLVFEIGNTMFSSKKDMEGAIVLFIFVIILVVIWLVLILKFNLDLPRIKPSTKIDNSLKLIDILMLVPIGIDFLVIYVFKLVDYLKRPS